MVVVFSSAPFLRRCHLLAEEEREKGKPCEWLVTLGQCEWECRRSHVVPDLLWRRAEGQAKWLPLPQEAALAMLLGNLKWRTSWVMAYK